MNHARLRGARSGTLTPTDRFLRWLVRGGAIAVALIALTAAVGWVSGMAVLTTAVPGLASMQMTTAVCVGLLATSALCTRARHIIACCVPVLGVTGLTLTGYALGTDSLLGLDELLWVGELPWIDGPHAAAEPGRMALASALCLAGLGAGRVMTAAGATGRAELVIVLGGSLAGVAELGYWYGFRDLYSAGPFATMSLPTAIAGTLLAIIFLAAVPGGSAQWMVAGADSGAHVLRWLLPTALFVAPVLALLFRCGEWAGLYSTGFALALAMEASALVILAVALRSAVQTRRADEDRRHTLAKLHSTNRRLEELAQRRAEHLAQAHTRTQVMADRERIAREVHEQIIGQVFGASMHIARVLPDVPDPSAAEALSTAMRDLDTALKSIRDVIHPLPAQASTDRANRRAAARVAATAASRAEPSGARPDPVRLRQSRPPGRANEPVATTGG